VSERTFLEEITIRSIGVIDSSTLEISKGLTVLSGETGAGKNHDFNCVKPHFRRQGG
jgi:DNA repair protein RecN (Recombination protein N)